MFVSYSCVQDPTKDLAPTISESGSGSGEVRTLQVALPTPSRTELGDSYVDAEGKTKYPVYWSEGDVLSVNGKKTTKISIDPHGTGDKSVAVFDMPLDASIPYHIVYPYTGESVNVGSGMYPVRFVTEQTHVEEKSTFAPNVAPMYAWSTGFEPITMKHLSTVLRFQIANAEGDPVALKYVSVSTLDAEPIAGVFDVYCGSNDENDEKVGSIVARESAISSVFYNFKDEEGEAVAHELSGEPSVFYIVVPKGSYSRFEVNFVDENGGVCVRTFDADGEYKLEGGTVREFPLIEYEVNSKMFLIGNDVEMHAFASEVNAGTFDEKYDGALLISDVDMTVSEKPWESLNGYKSVFEGRNYTIKGLTAPLFGENTVAAISNVAVEGALVEENSGKVGLIARSLSVEGDLVGTIFNCSVSGEILYNNTKLAVTNDPKLINVGGVVGGVYGGSVKKSHSFVNIKIENAAEEGAAEAFQPCVGGIVGYVCAENDKQPVVSENENNGTVDWDDQSKAALVTPFVGGVAGHVAAGEFADNVNSGSLSISEPMYDLDWGGVAGISSVAVKNCQNKGAMVINETVTNANVGGVLGQLVAASIEGCDNSGALLFNDKFVVNSSCNIGGVVAVAADGTDEILNCTNSGSIEYKGSCRCESAEATTGNGSIHIGGVVALAYSKLISNCANEKSGVVNIAGSISGNYVILDGGLQSDDYDFMEIDSKSVSSIGGVVATRLGKSTDENNPVSIEECSNAGNVRCSFRYLGGAPYSLAACVGMFDSDKAYKCSNDGKIEASILLSTDKNAASNGSTTLNALYVSGLFGCISSSCKNSATDPTQYNIAYCENKGEVICDNSEAYEVWVAGVVGQFINGVECKIAYCSNSNRVYSGKNVLAGEVRVGGFVAGNAWTAKPKVIYASCSNTGLVESASSTALSTDGSTYLGGISGSSYEWNTAGIDVPNITNDGTVKFSGDTSYLYMGGYSGLYYEKSHTVQFANTTNGNVLFANGSNVSKIALVGGISGCASKSKPGTSGYITGGTGVSINMVNNGTVSVEGYAGAVYAGGCFGFTQISRSLPEGGLVNNNTVQVKHDPFVNTYPEFIYLGGVFGKVVCQSSYDNNEPTTSNSIVDCNNNGTIKFDGIATNGAYVGGVAGKAETANLLNCTNTGSIISSGHAGSLPARSTQAEEKNAALVAQQLHYYDLAIGGVVGETDCDVVSCTNGGAADSYIKHTTTASPLKRDQWGEDASSRFDIGGVVGRAYVAPSNIRTYTLLLKGSSNHAAITIDGDYPYCTTNTSSVDLGNDATGTFDSNDIDDGDRTDRRSYYRMNVAGIVGRLHDHSDVYSGTRAPSSYRTYMTHRVENCSNNAPITLANAKKAKVFNLAGGVADILTSHTELDGVVNNGDISINGAGEGTNVSGTLRHNSFFLNMGGIVGMCFDYRYRSKTRPGQMYNETVKLSNCINNGDLSLKESGASFFQTAGGMIALALHAQAAYYVNGKWASNTCHFTDMSIEIDGCSNNGDISYYSDVVNDMKGFNYSYGGGIVGVAGNQRGNRYQYYAAVDLKISDSHNTGDVQFERSNGRRSSNIYAYYSAVGGVVGFYAGGSGWYDPASYNTLANANCPGMKKLPDGFQLTVTSCTNSGRIHSLSGVAGGIVGLGTWFVKITGSESAPTKNTGDIVVDRSGDEVRVNQHYTGGKVVYAGGIAGVLLELGDFTDLTNLINPANTMQLGSKSGGEGWIDYYFGTQRARVEYAVNEGAVGALNGFAGGIVGLYRSFKGVSDLMYNDTRHLGGIANCKNTGAIYSLEGSTPNVGAIIGNPRMFQVLAQTDHASQEGLDMIDKIWPLSVTNCEIGGSILRSGVTPVKLTSKNYYNYIFSESWSGDYSSLVSGKEYDGCVFTE